MTDKAQSYFHLAQLLATIAGFFIIAAGIFFGLSGQFLGQSIQINSDLSSKIQPAIFENISNLNQTLLQLYFETVKGDINISTTLISAYKESAKLGEFLVVFGCIFIAISIVVWFIGHKKCKD